MRNVVLAAAVALTIAAAGCGSSRPAEGHDAGCGSCHGFPPATLTAGGAHPQPATGTWVATDCAACHVTTVNATTGEVIPPPAGTHADGKVDGRHVVPYPETLHGPAANAGLATCQACHGSALDGGTSGRSCDQCHTGGTAAWRTNCTFCHGTFNATYTAANLPEAAPPADVAGTGTATTDLTVGVHQAHVTAVLSVPLDCSACHQATPTSIFDAGHVDGSPAEVPFGTIAKTAGRSPVWDRTLKTCASTWCHAQGGLDPTPDWTVAQTRTCASCHPSAPTTGRHTYHLGLGRTCADCHPGYTSTTVDAAIHINAVKELTPAATACHSTFGSSCNGITGWYAP